MKTVIQLFSYSMLTSVIVFMVLMIIGVAYIIDRRHDHKMHIADIWAMFVLIFITSIRYGVGSDYFKYLEKALAYGNFFSSIKDLFQLNVMRDYSYQVGYPALSVLTYKLFNNDYAIFFVVACVIYIPLIIYFRKKSPNVFYSIIVYLLFGLWGLSLNILKQAIAMTIICFAFEAYKNKKLILFLLLTIVGTMFHSTAALAAIGVVASSFIKPTIRNLWICLLTGVILKFSIMPIIRILTRFTIFNRYYARYISDGAVVGVNRTVIPIGVFLETAVVVYILYSAIKRRGVLSNILPDIDSYISVIMLSLPFSILGISGSLWLANRFAKFFSIFLTILIPTMMMEYKISSIRKRHVVIRVNKALYLILILTAWHFVYSSFMLDNNTFIIETLLF